MASSYWCTVAWSTDRSPDLEAAWTLLSVTDLGAPPDMSVVSSVASDGSGLRRGVS
jgi:hypothetical protein